MSDVTSPPRTGATAMGAEPQTHYVESAEKRRQRLSTGILILVGISMLLGSFFREEERAPKVPDIPFPLPVDPFKPHRPTPEPVATPKPTPAPPAEPIHRADLLPATCAHCGGPVRSYEVKWTGKQSAACSYCGSNLKMKKDN